MVSYDRFEYRYVMFVVFRIQQESRVLTYPEYEPQLLWRAQEPDPVLCGEVDDAGRVDGVQHVDDGGEAVHAVVVVAVLGFLN